MVSASRRPGRTSGARFINTNTGSTAVTSQLGGAAQSDADDIVFTDGTGTSPLSHDIELWEPATGTLVAWVRVVSLSATTNTVLYLYYGNPHVADQSAAGDVWDSSYQAVWHLDQDPSLGHPKGMKDSTTKNNHGTACGPMAAGAHVDGKTGKAVRFDGVQGYINMGRDASLNNRDPLTFQAWIYLTGWGENDYGRIFTKTTHSGYRTQSFYIQHGVLEHAARYSRDREQTPMWLESEVDSLELDQWYAVAVVVDTANSVGRLYINGSEAAYFKQDVGSGTVLDDSGYDLLVGNRGNQDRTFDGIIDEVRVSSTVRSAAWIETEFSNQSDPASFMTVGVQEDRP